MLDKDLLEQYADLMGDEGMQDMYATFADNIGGYLDHLQWLVKERKEQEVRNQAHRVKGACRSMGLVELARVMEKLERQQWSWEEVEEELVQWEKDLPAHQHQIETWLKARRI